MLHVQSFMNHKLWCKNCMLYTRNLWARTDSMTSEFHWSLTATRENKVSIESEMSNHLSKVPRVLPWRNKTDKKSVIKTSNFGPIRRKKIRQTFDTWLNTYFLLKTRPRYTAIADGPWNPEIIKSPILLTLTALAIVMNMSSYIQINQYFNGIPY